MYVCKYLRNMFKLPIKFNINYEASLNYKINYKIFDSKIV